MNANKLSYVKGTSGNPEYLIVSKRGRCVMAVKPEFGYDKKGLAFSLGVRVRVCADPEEVFTSKPLTANEITATFPTIKFTSLDNSRGSIGLGSVFKKGAVMTKTQAALAAVGKAEVPLYFTTAIYAALPVPQHPKEIVADWLQEQWEDQIIETCGAVTDTTEIAAKAMVEKCLSEWIGSPKPD